MLAQSEPLRKPTTDVRRTASRFRKDSACTENLNPEVAVRFVMGAAQNTGFASSCNAADRILACNRARQLECLDTWQAVIIQIPVQRATTVYFGLLSTPEY
jgi:hypothetical protein